MSGPYVYRPPAVPVSYTGFPVQQTPYYPSTPRASTPFIPDSAKYPSSPYSRPSSLHPSPNRSSMPLPRVDLPERYAFPSTGGAYDAGYDSGWEPIRSRRPSWHGGVNQSPWPGVPPPPHSPGSVPYGVGSAASVAAAAGYSQRRRHSFSAPAFDMLQVHPLLNAETLRPEFYFDVSLTTFQPLLLYANGQSIPIPPEEVAQAATYPPVTRLRIICEDLPMEWAIDIELPPADYDYRVRSGYEPPPITILDVLQALHRNLHLRISHTDFARLSPEANEVVRRAFTRRCKSAPGGFDGYTIERANGVKRVDYLGRNTRVVGLLRAPREDGWDVMRLVTTDPYGG